MSFFSDDGYFTGPPLSQALVESAEAKLGVVLPKAYLALLSERNGGTPLRRCYPMDKPTSWSSDHIEITGIRGVGGDWGIDADDLGSESMIEEWGYPRVGVVFCEMPSAGHDAVMLDYSGCGPEGEPTVVYIDEERRVHQIAQDFATFIAGLVPCGSFGASGRPQDA